MPSFEIRPYQEGDEVAILAALAELGASGTPGASGTFGTPPSAALWSWAHLGNPHGKRILVAWDGERVVGHFSLLPHRVWMDGREVVYSEIVHSFFLPGTRGGLGKEPPFAQIANAMFEAHGGSGEDGDLLFYGLPTKSEWRLGKKVLTYEVVRNQGLLGKTTGPGASELPAGVERLERFDHQVRWLWDRCVDGFEAGTIREEAFLNWRFSDHPEADYEILGVRDDEGVLRGYAVYGRGTWQGTEYAILYDWLVPESEPETAQLLRDGLLATARRDQLAELVTLIPDTSPWFQTFQDWDFSVLPAETFVYGRVFQRRFSVMWLRDSWWYTLADFAFPK